MISCIFAGCSATKAYLGPSLGADEIAKVYFYSQRGVDLSRMSVDGFTQGTFAAGFEVVPGEHTVYTEFQIVRQSCQLDTCREEVSSGYCRGVVRTSRGREYAIRVQSMNDSAAVAVSDRESSEQAGVAECERTSSHSRPSRDGNDAYDRRMDRPEYW